MAKRQEYFVHETSCIDEGVKIGKDTKIWHFSHVLKNSKIGERCIFGQNVSVGPDVTIGNNVKIQNNVSVYTGVTLEDDVFCGPSCVFTNIINPRCAYPRNSDKFYKKTIVKKGASIGANATIVCGVTLGKNAFVGAGAVVTKDVGDHELVYGSPAKHHGWMCECGEKLKFSKNTAKCLVCKKEYKKNKNTVAKK